MATCAVWATAFVTAAAVSPVLWAICAVCAATCAVCVTAEATPLEPNSFPSSFVKNPPVESPVIAFAKTPASPCSTALPNSVFMKLSTVFRPETMAVA